MEKDSKEVETSNYAVTYIDVLGQRDRLKQFPKVLLDKESLASLDEHIKGTYVRVCKVRDTFKDYFEGHENRPRNYPMYNALSDRQKAEFKKLEGGKLSFQHFSDTIVFYAPLKNVEGELNIRPILLMLSASALSMLINLSRKIPIRGSIEIGAATNWPDFGIYGSALYSTYDLESKVALYPRIVVGDELIKYLSRWIGIDKGDPVSKFNKELATRCFSIICEDEDGRPIVDFLSQNLPKLFERSIQDEPFQVLKDKVAQGFEFVKQQHEHFKNKKDSDLAFRYALLKEYYLARLDNWGLMDTR